jgi:alpha-tubulin suppressor-like RCC1 family protein
VAIANTHSCALLADGGVSCWGYNVNGELGNGTTVPLSTVPVPVTGITNATALAANAFHSCAVLADGRVECWGGNNYGQLGNGTSLQSNVPVAVTGLTDATDLAVGYHLCVCGRILGEVVTANSATACGLVHRWCRLRSAAPARPPCRSTATCAILGNGDMSCWGSNWFGQLGNGTNDESIAPIAVPGITGVTDLAAGTGHTCVIVDDEAASCWGYNASGQLGNGTTMSSNVPVPVPGLS